jgi:hypothetical protein
MAAIVEDLTQFFPDFGVSATVGGVALTGIFDNAFLETLGITAGSSPSLLIVSSAAPSATHGTSVVVGGASYTVTAVEPDGTGMALLRLQEV